MTLAEIDRIVEDFMEGIPVREESRRQNHERKMSHVHERKEIVRAYMGDQMVKLAEQLYIEKSRQMPVGSKTETLREYAQKCIGMAAIFYEQLNNYTKQ